jgi:hypothetical protein
MSDASRHAVDAVSNGAPVECASSDEYARALSGRVARSLSSRDALEAILEELDTSAHASSLECARLRAFVAQYLGLSRGCRRGDERRARLRLVVSRRRSASHAVVAEA